MHEILIADDDASIRTVLTQALSSEGYRVRAASNAATLFRWTEAGHGDLVITDVIMPDENIFDVMPRIVATRPDLPVIVISAQNTFMTAIQATESGAYDYLPKPFDLDELVSTVRRALDKPVDAEQPVEATPGMPLVGRSPAMQDIYRIIARMTRTDLTVLITGESGTGKELVARALHDFSARKAGPFVAVNMAAIPRDLIESELFGHEQGSFTGADRRSEGRFQQASGGTLFLDEIGDMPQEAQTRLLRVLQEGEYTSVGGRTPIRTDVRIVAATHQDLEARIEAGAFREDLFYRINVVPIRVPTLRKREQDIPDLARHFLQSASEMGLPAKTIDTAALDRLRLHSWPGNVRELENLVQRLVALHPQEHITADLVSLELGSSDFESLAVDSPEVALHNAAARLTAAMLADPERGEIYRTLVQTLEASVLPAVMQHCGNNQLRAASRLGLNRNTLRKKLSDLS
ncbi:nitrogen regulation protein NR(I) [Rhizobiaceae bacterium]|nr:nitrogen regulation protein NR(I) [Rhizobiaceae bacterium]